MRRAHSVRALTILALFALASVAAFGQTTWTRATDVRTGQAGRMIGTVVSVDSSGLSLEPDGDPMVRVRVDTSGSTRFAGLGVDARTTATGYSGLSQLRVRDRVEVRGTGDTGRSIRATDVQLIGRSVTATAPSGNEGTGTFQGTVRDINTFDQSFTLETGDGQRIRIVGDERTPVTYRGETAQIRNLENGDGVRVDTERRLGSGEYVARRIEVLSDSTPDGPGDPGVRDFVSGRVARVDARRNRFTFRIDRGREIDVDASKATNTAGAAYRVADLQEGDRLRLWGEYESTGVFRATRIDWGRTEDAEQAGIVDQGQEPFEGFSTVVFNGTVESNPQNEDKLVIRERDSRREVTIVVDEEFVVLRETGFVRASQLRAGDSVAIKAFRDQRGNYVAQTIRLR